MKNLTTGHPLKLIFFFALPLMFGNFLQQLYIMVDTMIVGRFVGVDALASIGGADWINWAILGLLMGFTQGFSIRVSNCLGANDEKGMGISEQLFLRIFLPIFGSKLLLPGMLLSRGLGYYTELILSALLTIVANFTIGRNVKKG